jgi:hypothetical protein
MYIVKRPDGSFEVVEKFEPRIGLNGIVSFIAGDSIITDNYCPVKEVDQNHSATLNTYALVITALEKEVANLRDKYEEAKVTAYEQGQPLTFEQLKEKVEENG